MKRPEPKISLVTGGTGAGKTTYARNLCEEIGGLRFSIDDWMTGLFWMDAPDGGGTFEWAMERITRAETLIRQTAEQALRQGLPPADVRWKRVQSRNHEKGETFAMTVPRDMFDFMEGEWENPDPEKWENSQFVIVQE